MKAVVREILSRRPRQGLTHTRNTIRAGGDFELGVSFATAVLQCAGPQRVGDA